MKPLFNVVFHDGQTKFPDDKILYILTKKGPFIRKNLGTVCSCTPVQNISFLKELQPYAELKIPQIIGRHMARAVGFLKWIYNTHRSEGGLLIYYNTTTKEYIIHAPKQKVSGASVNWDNTVEMIPKGFIRMGTIHSHASMSAFHSGTDVADEVKFDGLHITIGHLDDAIPSIVASVVVNGTRFPVSQEQIRRYLDIVPIGTVTKEETKQQSDNAPIYEDYRAHLSKTNGPVVKHMSNYKNFSSKHNSSFGKGGYGGYTYSYMGKDEMKFRIPKVLPRDYDFPNEWKEKVEKETYTGGVVYRVVNGQVVKFESQNQIGFRGKDESFWTEDELNDFNGYDNFDYYQNPYGVGSRVGQMTNSDLYPLPHADCADCMYKIIAEEALEMGAIDLDELLSEAVPTGLQEEEFQHYGKHVETGGGNPDSVSFDKDGNIIDKEGNIVERLVKENNEE